MTYNMPRSTHIMDVWSSRCGSTSFASLVSLTTEVPPEVWEDLNQIAQSHMLPRDSKEDSSDYVSRIAGRIVDNAEYALLSRFIYRPEQDPPGIYLADEGEQDTFDVIFLMDGFRPEGTNLRKRKRRSI